MCSSRQAQALHPAHATALCHPASTSGNVVIDDGLDIRGSIGNAGVGAGPEYAQLPLQFVDTDGITFSGAAEFYNTLTAFDISVTGFLNNAGTGYALQVSGRARPPATPPAVLPGPCAWHVWCAALAALPCHTTRCRMRTAWTCLGRPCSTALTAS